MAKDDSKKSKKKKQGSIDRVVMGAIIGTAIGSAIGMSVAPKKGSETREALKKKSLELNDDLKEVGTLTKETTFGLLKLVKNLLFSAKPKTEKTDPALMRQIPTEMDIIPEEYMD